MAHMAAGRKIPAYPLGPPQSDIIYKLLDEFIDGDMEWFSKNFANAVYLFNDNFFSGLFNFHGDKCYQKVKN